MAFDVFGLRDHVVRDYREYVESFIHIRDPRIERRLLLARSSALLRRPQTRLVLSSQLCVSRAA